MMMVRTYGLLITPMVGDTGAATHTFQAHTLLLPDHAMSINAGMNPYRGVTTAPEARSRATGDESLFPSCMKKGEMCPETA